MWSNNYQPTEKELQDARIHAAKPYRECARLARISRQSAHLADHVNRFDYAKQQDEIADRIETSEKPTSFAIWQAMNYFLTNESVAFLSK